MPIDSRADRGGARRDCPAAIRAAAGDQVGRASLRGRVPPTGPGGTVAGGLSIGQHAVHSPGRCDDPVSAGLVGPRGGRCTGERDRGRSERGADGEAGIRTTLVGTEASGAGARTQGTEPASSQTQGAIERSGVADHSRGGGTDVGCRSSPSRAARSIGSALIAEVGVVGSLKACGRGPVPPPRRSPPSGGRRGGPRRRSEG